MEIFNGGIFETHAFLNNDLDKVFYRVPGDNGIKFGLEKCSVLNMKRGKQVPCEGIDLGDGGVIEEAVEEECKYLGILERDGVCQEKLTEKTQKEYYKQVRAVLKSKLNGGTVINTINIYRLQQRFGMGLE